MELKFDWDQWNIQKNEIKHGVSQLEAESLFFDPAGIVFTDQKHSTVREVRYIMYARSYSDRIMMCAFTIRSQKVRIISVRPTSKKERTLYEEKNK